MQRKIACHIMRGGTSKGVYLLEKHLPPAGPMRDKVLLDMMGSPDIRQIDGLGGATSVTSKVAIIRDSDREDADVDYTFAQVSVDREIVDYKGNCGNISSGVGPFALEVGLVPITEEETTVRIYNTNTGKIIHAVIQTPGGEVTYEGTYAISGVPGTAAQIKLIFVNPGGSVFGQLLPTGNPVDILEVPGVGPIEVSLVDAANPLIFIRARDIGLTGKELPHEFVARPELLELLERIRGSAAVQLGLSDSWENAAAQSPAIPKMTIVAEPADYLDVNGTLISGDQIDLLARMMSMQKPHETYAMTGAICTVCAAVIPDTLVHQLTRADVDHKYFRIGNPSGITDAGAEYECGGTEVRIKAAYGLRTARMILEGNVFLKEGLQLF